MAPPPRGSLGKPDVRDVAVYIYAFCEPDTLEVRYVGRSQNPRCRLTQQYSCDGATFVHDWLWDLRRRGLAPALRILRGVRPGDDADVAERAAIAAYAGPRLLNVNGNPCRERAETSCFWTHEETIKVSA